jgi:hypothetical protein
VNPLLELLAQRFIDHYYPALDRHGKTRQKQNLKDILWNMTDVFHEGGVPRLKRAIVRNYKRHLEEESTGSTWGPWKRAP